MQIKPHGMSAVELDFLVKNGVKYDKRKRKQLLTAFEDEYRPTKENLVKYFQELCLLPSDEYLDFLVATNGGKPVPDVLKLAGYKRDFVVKYFYSAKSVIPEVELQYACTLFESRIPSGMLPIAHDPSGSLFLLSCRDDVDGVFYWDHAMEVEGSLQPYFGNLQKIADNFSEFISLFK